MYKHGEKAFVAYNSDIKVREQSSSGGIFYALSKNILKKGGVVFGVAYDDNFCPKYQIATDENELRIMMGSKYVFSQIGDAFGQAQSLLRQGTKVMFVGTPCIIASLKNSITGKTDNLYTVDFVCHGCVKPQIWTKYKKYLEDKYKSKIRDYSFRDKKFGWEDFAIKVDFENEKNYYSHHNADVFYCMFRDNFTLCDSCYKCKYKGATSGADVTLSDAWGSEKFSAKKREGLSYVICNTVTGREWFEDTGEIVKQPIEYAEFIMNQSYYMKSAEIPKNKLEFSLISDWDMMMEFYIKSIKWPFKSKKDVHDGRMVLWGCGKVFKIYAHMMIMLYAANCVCDTNCDKWGEEVYPGITCIDPHELVITPDLMIVIMIEDEVITNDIRIAARRMGIEYCVSYKELMHSG